MKNNIVISFFLIACLLLSSLMVVSADAPWLTGWNKRQLFYWQTGTPLNASAPIQGNITILNQTGINTVNTVTFYIYNETRLDFDDLRVTTSNGQTVIAQWNQSTNYGLNCTAWFLFPSNGYYYLYWNNLNASNIWNQNAVFPNGVYSGLVGAWNMEQTGNSLTDFSGNGNTATPTGTTNVNSPFYNGKNAKQLNGVNESITIPDFLWVNGTNDFAIVSKIKVLANPASGVFIQQFADASNRIQFRISNGGANLRAVATGININDSPGATAWPNNPVTVIFQRANNVWSMWQNTTQSATYNHADSLPNLAANIELGHDTSNAVYLNFICSGLFVFTGLTSAQIANFSSQINYPDVTLQASSVCLRNYVFPAPYISQFGQVETAPTPTPSPSPVPEVTAEGALAVGIAGCIVVLGVCATLGLLCCRCR